MPSPGATWSTEYAFCCAQAMAGLSRLSEELVLWGTTEFGWATYDDATVTGSSALPQKQNPDIAELARGRAATVLGDVTALLALQKGLPLAYQRDLQEDKALVFHADDTLAATLEALGAMLAGATIPSTSTFGSDHGARHCRAAHRERRPLSVGPPGSGTAGGVARGGWPRPRFGNGR